MRDIVLVDQDVREPGQDNRIAGSGHRCLSGPSYACVSRDEALLRRLDGGLRHATTEA